MPGRSSYQILDRLFDGGLEAYLTEARDLGMSYEAIAAQLADLDGVDLSYRTIARWCADLGIKKAS